MANSSEEMQQLRRPFRWLEDGLDVVGTDSMYSSSVFKHMAKYPELASEVASLLSDVDVPVSEVRSEERPTLASLANGNLNAKHYKVTLTHQSALGTAEFDLGEESVGTRNLIEFAIPWFIHQLATGETGGSDVLLVDEFDSSLHPNIVAALVKRHLARNDSKQLIFTTHDTHLMDANLLRRDQFWLTERDENGATQLRSIHD